MKPYLIGIDLGTGSAKAVAMNHAGEVIDSAQVAYPTHQPQQGYQEQDPEIIWQAFVKSIAKITSRHGDRPDAICFSSAMHSVIPVDSKGLPLMNMMIWADNRSASFARSIHRSPAGRTLYERSGTPIHAMTPLCKLVWLKHNDPQLFARSGKFISIKEYVWFRLFGVYEADYSIASATGLLDIERLDWNDEALAVAGIRPAQLSTVVNTNHSRKCADPSLRSQLGIAADTNFIIGASDGCLANVGSFATEEGFLAVTIGTSGAVRVTRNKPMLNFKSMTFNYLLDESTYVCGGPVNNGGIALKWYAENLLGKKLDSPTAYATLFDALADTRPGSDGLIFLPYLLGERAPIWNSDASGVFFGIRGHHQQRHFTRAVIEGVSAALYDITDNMVQSGLDIRQIHVSGGFVRSDQWLQIFTDLFGKKVCLVNTADASSVGAVYLAMKALGMISDYHQLKPDSFKEYLPNPENMTAYRDMFLRYREVSERVEGLF